MRNFFLIVYLLTTPVFLQAQRIAIGSISPDSSAKLDISSNTGGFLPPRMTYVQRNAIQNPAQGLILYCIDCGIDGELEYFNGQSWKNFSGGTAATAKNIPTISTTTTSNVTNTAVLSGGNVLNDGGLPVLSRGVVWSDTGVPTINLPTKTIDSSGVGIFTSRIAGLTPNTTYQLRAYATNALGTAYGDLYTFNTLLDSGKYYEYAILPSATHSAITTYNNEHEVVLDTRVPLKNKLFLFLPGTTGYPAVYKQIVKRAAALGYHAIGLMYPNNSDIYTAAGSNNDLNEFGKCRQEIFDGSDQTTGVNVNTDNCIKTRLNKLLVYLQQHYPGQAWQQFLVNGEIDWSKCVVSGHSQGGGHAFFIAKKFLVDRVISFSSIDWNTNLNQSATWVTQPGPTPISKFYSFNGLRDQIFSYSNVVTQLSEMGLTGPAISIDSNQPPYSNSHTLTTNATASILVLFPDHNITVLDAYVPKDNQGNVVSSFLNAWTYLLNY